jgi:predicted DNA-binding protein (MmcQ/YjbR family)
MQSGGNVAMNLEELCDAILACPEATEGQPFGPGVLVYKVRGKMFALVAPESPPSVSLKCNPVLATMLRDTYPAVTAGYHLDKRHWNTVVVDGTVPTSELLEWIEHSYDLVVKGLPKRDRQELGRGI